MRDVMLARNWSTKRVLECIKKEQKAELVRFLDERYNERFFRPILCLRNAPGNEQGYGFAIMALCCLLIETIQCYREGLPSSDDGGGSGKMFKLFFQEDSPHWQYFPDVSAEEFYKEIRCGLLHQAQTKGTWRLVRKGRFWNDDDSEKTINRDEFAQRLEECFKGYLRELSEGDWNSRVWEKARRKISSLAQVG